MRVVLASASPRRLELLKAAGIDCDVDPVDVDEGRRHDERAAAYVERVARLKAEAGALRHRTAVVIGADTAVAVGEDGLVLGKPRDVDDAARMVTLLAGRAHDVLTGVAVAHGGRVLSGVERTTVWFRSMSVEEVQWYAASGEPLDKAGAYAIQGLASRFIPRIDGSYSNVVGLPVARVIEMFEAIGCPLEPRRTGRS